MESSRCRWIDRARLPVLEPGARVVLFGAGQGSVELLGLGLYAVAAIADNDPGMQGREMQGLPIIAPDDIPGPDQCVVVVTTISGEEPVTIQLRDMGFTPGKDSFAVGRYPDAAMGNLRLLLNYAGVFGLDMSDPGRPGLDILHVGPGGFLGLECCLYALGHAPVSVDAYSFGALYPDVTDAWPRYAHCRKRLLELLPEGKARQLAGERFDSLFERKHGRITLSETAMAYHHPHRFSALPCADGSLDLVLSFAVLEHVRDPEQALREMLRVLRPGGAAVARIITRDHRSFSSFAEYTPWSYLLHGPAQWELMNKQKFHQNRLLPHEWKALFEDHFTVLEYRTLDRFPLPEGMLSRIRERRPELGPEQLEPVNCEIVAVKSLTCRCKEV